MRAQSHHRQQSTLNHDTQPATRRVVLGLSGPRYNPEMAESVFNELKRYVGFTERDADRVRRLGEIVRPQIPQIVARFYDVLLRHPGAARVFSGPEQIERLRTKLSDWLDTLFCGVYDDAYSHHRSQIGRTHVRVGLNQHYMFGAMEIIRQELHRSVNDAGVPDAEEMLDSLNKLLTLETGVMLETFQEANSEQLRAIERIALGERLSRAERLAEIGQLAASLAHEIKNPLAGISGAVQVMRDATPGDDPHFPILAEILRQIDRLDGTVEDLLVYARPKVPQLRTCNPAEVMQRTVTLLHKQPPLSSVCLEINCDPSLPNVDLDPDQIEQVLINVILNAVQASRAGGVVRVAAQADSASFELLVHDSGHGMSDSVRRRAFEPFFTTKARGTGLGLAICRQIIQAHNGSMDLQSEPGVGTTVVIRLPLRQTRESD